MIYKNQTCEHDISVESRSDLVSTKCSQARPGSLSRVSAERYCDIRTEMGNLTTLGQLRSKVAGSFKKLIHVSCGRCRHIAGMILTVITPWQWICENLESHNSPILRREESFSAACTLRAPIQLRPIRQREFACVIRHITPRSDKRRVC